MTNYKERIERMANRCADYWCLPNREFLADMIAAFLGDDKVYVYNPETGYFSETDARHLSHLVKVGALVPLGGDSSDSKHLEPEHVCGLAGFNPMEGDWCPGAHGGDS